MTTNISILYSYIKTLYYKEPGILVTQIPNDAEMPTYDFSFAGATVSKGLFPMTAMGPSCILLRSVLCEFIWSMVYSR